MFLPVFTDLYPIGNPQHLSKYYLRKLSMALKCMVLCLPFIFAVRTAHAQEAIKIGKEVNKQKDLTAGDIYAINNMIQIDDSLSGWKMHWRGGVQGSQASYNNWSSGGVNAVSGTAATFFQAMYRKKRWGYALGINLKYGRAHLAHEGGRKTDDYIAINNKFSHWFKNKHWNAFIDINLITQFDRGYDYNVPDSVQRKLISAFFAPAYLNEIAGLGFEPDGHFTAEAGLALKETFVKNDSLSQQYGLDPGVNFRLEPGYSIRLVFQNTILKNVKIKSSFETFTNIKRTIRHTDFIYANTIIGKINKYLDLTFQFDVAYNDHFSNKLQVKEVLGAGLSFTIL
jgi:hypothetical protein